MGFSVSGSGPSFLRLEVFQAVAPMRNGRELDEYRWRVSRPDSERHGSGLHDGVRHLEGYRIQRGAEPRLDVFADLQRLAR